MIMEILMVFYIFCLGICIGSFLNVLIDRLPAEQSVIKGRSHCDHCQKNLHWFELIPLLSYIYQRGKSLCCHKNLSLQYPLIELVSGIGFIVIAANIPGLWDNLKNGLLDYSFIRLTVYWIIFSCLLVIFVADLKTQIIPDSMIFTGILAGILRIWLIPNFTFYILNFTLSAIGAGFFFFMLWLITRGRGMGFGDVKLVVLLGILVGYPGIIISLYIAFLTGAVAGVILILIRHKTFKSIVPFGPFLIAGTIISLVWQSQILEWWKGFI
jgi:leader peptidase (prepilin peptidase) / N-methyltransferase